MRVARSSLWGFTVLLLYIVGAAPARGDGYGAAEYPAAAQQGTPYPPLQQQQQPQQQQQQPPPPVQSPPPPPEQVSVQSLGPANTSAPPSSDVKPPSRGFQMAFRTGMSFPIGDATGDSGDRLGRRYAWQVPLALDLGVKVTDAIFIGGYMGVAFGSEGSDARIEAFCDDDDDNLHNDISCGVFGFQIGLQVHYSLDPGARWNPWIGYGIGYEVEQQTISDDTRPYREVTSASGITLAKLMFGADYRGGVGFGPYVEGAIGRYVKAHTEVNDDETHDGTIGNQAFHVWLTLGIRLVVSP